MQDRALGSKLPARISVAIEKGDPEWAPKTLACPGGLAVPRILANIATLLSGGMKGVLAK